MKKLIKSLKWLDKNIVNIFLYIYIFFIPLYFKLPFIDLEFTYISIRLEDVFIFLFFKALSTGGSPFLFL